LLALLISQQIAEYEPARITLPWKTPDGLPHTATLFFGRSDGRPHHRQSFSYTWQAARAAAGAPNTRANGMHVLRHTAASAWLAAGVDIRTVAEYLGHSDPGFTLKTYAHLMPGASDRARRAMDAFFQDTGEASALEVPSDVR
jgi:integrase